MHYFGGELWVHVESFCWKTMWVNKFMLFLLTCWIRWKMLSRTCVSFNELLNVWNGIWHYWPHVLGNQSKGNNAENDSIPSNARHIKQITFSNVFANIVDIFTKRKISPKQLHPQENSTCSKLSIAIIQHAQPTHSFCRAHSTRRNIHINQEHFWLSVSLIPESRSWYCWASQLSRLIEQRVSDTD